MNKYKSVSILFFFAGFALFFASVFCINFKLNTNILLDSTKNKNATFLFTSINPQLFTKTYCNQFSFIKALDLAFLKFNTVLIKQFGFTKKDKERIIYICSLDNKVKYNLATLENFLLESKKNSEFKIDQLRGNTLELERKIYNSVADLEDDLEKKLFTINAEIIDSRGFKNGEIKKLKFLLSKSSANGKFLPYRKWFAIFSLCISASALFSFFYVEKKFKSENKDLFINNRTHNYTGTMMVIFFVCLSAIILFALLYWPELVTNLF